MKLTALLNMEGTRRDFSFITNEKLFLENQSSNRVFHSYSWINIDSTTAASVVIVSAGINVSIYISISYNCYMRSW